MAKDSKNKVSVEFDEWYELKKEKIISDCKKELMKWISIIIAIIVSIVTILGFLGYKNIGDIRSQFKDNQDQVIVENISKDKSLSATIQGVVTNELELWKHRNEIEQLRMGQEQGTPDSSPKLTNQQIEDRINHENRAITEKERLWKENSQFHITLYYNEKNKEFYGDVLKKLSEYGFNSRAYSIQDINRLLSDSQIRGLPNFDLIMENLVTYSKDQKNERKSEEIVRILSDAFAHIQWSVMPPDKVAENYMDRFVPRSSIDLFSKEKGNLIQIYLVQ
jgi:hypothetical protein